MDGVWLLRQNVRDVLSLGMVKNEQEQKKQ